MVNTNWNRKSPLRHARWWVSLSVRLKRGLRTLGRLPTNAVRCIRKQADRETFARLDARSARLERGQPDSNPELMSHEGVYPVVCADPDDPLELLWKLRSGQP